MRDIVNGRMRTIRGGRLGVRPRQHVPPAVRRCRALVQAQKDTKATHSNLEAKLDKIAKRIKEARISGRRFAYKEPLRDLYEMAYRWNERTSSRSVSDMSQLFAPFRSART
jgi:hypothetical protein